MRLRLLCTLLFAVVPAASYAQVPEYAITPQQSMIKFHVKSSIDLTGKFEHWGATLKFSSAHVESGVLDIRIRAASVHTGSRLKNDKLKSKDFFNVAHDPWITFKSTKVDSDQSDDIRCARHLYHPRSFKARNPDIDGGPNRQRLRTDSGNDGLRPQGLWNGQQYSVSSGSPTVSR